MEISKRDWKLLREKVPECRSNTWNVYVENMQDCWTVISRDRNGSGIYGKESEKIENIQV